MDGELTHKPYVEVEGEPVSNYLTKDARLCECTRCHNGFWLGHNQIGTNITISLIKQVKTYSFTGKRDTYEYLLCPECAKLLSTFMGFDVYERCYYKLRKEKDEEGYRYNYMLD